MKSYDSRPRKLSEVINGEEVTYEDAMWLPSATDVFGSPDRKWWPDEPDSFQLPIFIKKRDRAKELEDASCIWWLRSVGAADVKHFCGVDGGGAAGGNGADCMRGFASGFDIGGGG